MIGALTHAQAPSKTTYSNIPLSVLSQALVKHVRMSREVTTLTRPEKNKPKKPRPSIGLLVSSSLSLVGVPSPVETSPGTAKRRWYQPPLLRDRNHSMQDISSSAHMVADAPAAHEQNECTISAVPVITIGHEEPSETETSLSPSTRDTRRYGMIIEGYASLYSRSSPDINNGFLDAQAPSSATTSLFHLPNITSSTLQTSIYSIEEQKGEVDEEDEDESGRILLAALGLADPTPSDPEAEQPPSADVHSAIDSLDLQADPPPPTKSLATQQSSPTRRPPTRVPTLDAIRVPAPLDLHDAFAYVFGSTIRSSTIAQADAAPPPYAPRQSMALNPRDNRSQTTHEDIPSRGGSPDLASVAPLSVQRRGEKQAIQRRWAIENQ